MRIVIDLQGVQGASRHRGIGRYSLSLAQAMVRNRGNHEVLIALNGLFPESIMPIRVAFDGLLPQKNIRVWHAEGPVHPLDSNNAWRRHTAELVREDFLASLKPDVLHITSLFEGFGDDAVHTVGLHPASIVTAVTLYDLIPLIQCNEYLKPNPMYEVFYREKLAYLKQADLYLAISESSKMEAQDHLNATYEQVENIAAAADDHFRPIQVSEADKHDLCAHFGITRPFLMYSGATDERKNHIRLIKAFSLLPSSLRANYQLAIVGGLPNEHRKKFEACAKTCGLKTDDVVITGRVTDEEMVQFYNLCELFVFPSLHEGFGLPALEAMSCGAPVIGANTSSLPEVIGREDALFDPFDENAISQKIADVLRDDILRKDLARHGLVQAKNFSWDESAKKAIAAFERLHVKQDHESKSEKYTKNSKSWLIEAIAKQCNSPTDELDWCKTAKAIAQNRIRTTTRKQLLIDISELVHHDAKSGIQRVVRSVLAELLTNCPLGFTVEPIYANINEPGYRYARKFTALFLNDLDQSGIEDDPVEVFSGDIFLGLDLQPHVVPYQVEFYQYLQRIGAQVFFVVYDLLPITMPHVFPCGAYESHNKWLRALTRADGVLCISRSVADEMVEWLNVVSPQCLRPFKLGWFHLGADVSCSIPSQGLPADADQVLSTLSCRPTFLMVGTVEPRKEQVQTLAAFERLWAQNVDANLVIVGKHGWDVDLFVDKLRNHPQRNLRLFWLDGISDEYLEKVYAVSSCLIAASIGEGFGLPLIEAAQHKKPIIARDIPIFREVAGPCAFYFSGSTPDELANTVCEWLLLDKAGNAPQSDTMPWLTWKQSTQNLLDVMLNDQWYQQWMPDDIHRFLGSDNQLGTQVGQRNGRDMITTGSVGYLLFGPYLALAAGQYLIKIKGLVGSGGLSGARMDVAINKGTIILAESILSEPDLNGCMAIVPISLDQSCTDIEVRVWVSDQSDLKVSMIEIAPWQDEPIISQEVLKDAEQKVAQVSVSASSVIKNTSRLASTSSSRNQAKSKRKKRR